MSPWLPVEPVVERPLWTDLYCTLNDAQQIPFILERTGGRFTREDLEQMLAEDEETRRTWDPALRRVFALLREIPADGDLVAQWHRERAEDLDRAADAIEAGADPLEYLS